MSELKQIFKDNIKQYWMLLITLVLVAFFQTITGGIILRPQNVTNLVLQNAYVIIIAVGMMCCILTGGNVDLSVGSLCAFNGAICGYLIIGRGWNTWLVLGITIMVALLTGVWNGGFIAKFGVPAFIATLSSQLVFRGGTYIVLKGVSYTGYPEEFLALTTGYLPDLPGEHKLHIATLLFGAAASIILILLELSKRRKKLHYKLEVLSTKFFVAKLGLIILVVNYFTYSLASYKGLPIVLIPVVVIVLIYSYVTQNTVAGRYLYAVGGNRKAAQLSGINDKMVLFAAYVNMALLSGIAGIVFTARMNSCSPMAGNGFEGDAIAACYIGGASASGGAGTIIGAVIGAFVIGLLNNGMSIMGLQSDVQMCVKGLVLLGAVVFDLIQKNKSR